MCDDGDKCEKCAHVRGKKHRQTQTNITTIGDIFSFMDGVQMMIGQKYI